jgi:hypothetical protein
MRTIVSAAGVFIAVLIAAPGTLSQGGVTDAPLGVETGNGFVGEFCANQGALTTPQTRRRSPPMSATSKRPRRNSRTWWRSARRSRSSASGS